MAARDNTAAAFGRALKEARKAAGQSQEELAELAGIHRTYPSMLERGIRTPTLAMVIQLAVALRVPPEALLARTLGAMGPRPLFAPARQITLPEGSGGIV